MPRFRFTIRRMMVVVALVGIALVCYRRRQDFLQRAEIERVMAYLGEHGHHGRARQVWIDYHCALERKYGRAARYPWLPLAPDPPKPK